MKLYINDVDFGLDFTRVVRAAHYIDLYDDTQQIAHIENADFSVCRIEGGDWSDPPKTDSERIADLEAIIEAQAAALEALGVTE